MGGYMSLKSNYIIILVCFLTVISQLPLFVTRGLSSIIAQSIWFVFAIIVFVSNRRIKIVKQLYWALFVVLVFTAFVLIMSLTGTSYISTNLYSSVVLSSVVFFIGTNIKINRIEDLETIYISYSIGTVVLALSIYYQYLRGASIIGRQYLYTSKNSAAIIIVTGLVIIFVYWFKRKPLVIKITALVLSVFILYVLAMLKCRAALASLPIIVAYCIFISKISRKLKMLLVFLCLVLVISLVNDNLFNIIVNNVIFAGRGGELVSLSSGRSEGFLSFFDDMSGKWLAGDGTSFRESLPLAAMLKFGVFIGSMIIIYAFWPLFKGLKISRAYGGRDNLMFVLMALIYSFDALVEQLSPFGPGVRCFIYWFMFGIYINNSTLLIKGEINANAE